MFVIACLPTEEACEFGYGPFDTRVEAAEWLTKNAEYSIRIGNTPCDNEHDIIEIFTAREDGSIA
jgi:hypothetical protein